VLRSQLDGARRIDPAKLAADDVDFIVERSFERYFDDGGQLGTVAKARRTVERFERMGVDEVACLIDFGLPTKTVLAELEHLNRLREALGRPGAVRRGGRRPPPAARRIGPLAAWGARLPREGRPCRVGGS
jgi:hypothetical protein